MKISKTYHFYAGHRNKAAGKKCGRIHGHTYDVTCVFEFTNLDNGITMLFSDIDEIAEPIIKQYDHFFLLYEQDPLAELFELAGEEYISLPFESSAENMAIWIFNQIRTELPIVKIELAETKSSTIIYEQSLKD
jgi:6-pyruvoyl-tetrahydropterin synthase